MVRGLHKRKIERYDTIMKLYKYKALPYKKSVLNKEEKEQIKYCKDILLNNRLFMAPRESLNDCFEGMAFPIHMGICG